MIIGKFLRISCKYTLVPILARIIQNRNFNIAIVPVERLGHLAKNTHLFFIRKRIGSLPNLKYVLIAPSLKSNKIANVSLLRMFVEYSEGIKNVDFICSTFIYLFFTFFLYEFKKFKIIYEFPMESKEIEFSLGVKTIDFSEKQKKYGEKLFKRIPIPQDKKIVTIFARDTSYLNNRFPNEDWDYHFYRDADIETYVDSIKYLISENYLVIRIGSEYSKKLNFSDVNYFEYSLSEFKSDFMDLYLINKSSFVVGTTSGAIDISTIFNIPFVGVNFAPFMEFPLGKDDIFIQKKIINSKNEVVPFKDIISNKEYYLFDGLKFFNNFGLKYLDNTSLDILEATKEMCNVKNGNFVLNMSQLKLLKNYHIRYCQESNWSKSFAPISISWLEQNHVLYFDDVL